MSNNFVVVKLNVLLTYVEAAQLDGWSKDGAALITITPHIACIHVVQQYLNIFPQLSLQVLM